MAFASVQDSIAIENEMPWEDSDVPVTLHQMLRQTRDTCGKNNAVSFQLLSGADIHPGLAGASFAPASTSSDSGVEVTNVEEGSPAAQRGLRAGDVITAVNRVLVRNLRDLQTVAGSSRILFLLVQRGDRSLMLQIR